jgi:hypothetical protein
VGADLAVDGQLLGSMIRHASPAGAVSRLAVAVIGSTFLALLVAPVGLAARLASGYARTSVRTVEAPSTTGDALEETTLALWANCKKDNQASAPLPRTQRT